MSACPGHGHNNDLFHANPADCSTLRERQDKAAQEAFGHRGVGYSSMKPWLREFIDSHLTLEDQLAVAEAKLKAVEDFIGWCDVASDPGEGWYAKGKISARAAADRLRAALRPD